MGLSGAADFGRRRVLVGVIDSRRHFAGLGSFWYVVASSLHRLSLAVARMAVNEDESGETAIDPCLWSAGAVPSSLCLEDVSASPYSVSILVKISALLGSLYWPCEERDLGVGGVSYLELLLLYKLRAGERLVCEKAVSKMRRKSRPIPVSAAPVCPDIEMWKSSRYLEVRSAFTCGSARWYS